MEEKEIEVRIGKSKNTFHWKILKHGKWKEEQIVLQRRNRVAGWQLQLRC